MSRVLADTGMLATSDANSLPRLLRRSEQRRVLDAGLGSVRLRSAVSAAYGGTAELLRRA